MKPYSMQGKCSNVSEVVKGSFSYYKLVLEQPANNKVGKNVIAFRSKNIPSCKVGDEVSVEFYIDGREWKNPTTGETAYFTDLTVSTITVVSEAAGSAGGASAKTALAAFVAQGNDKSQFGAYCGKIFPGKPSKDYTAADWKTVTDAINGAPIVADEDDMPF